MVNLGNYKIGDKYLQPTFEYFEWLQYNDELNNDFYGKKDYETTIKYITPTGGLILEINEDMTPSCEFENSLFKGSEIKTYYPDFEGDDDKEYCALYEEDSPFY